MLLLVSLSSASILCVKSSLFLFVIISLQSIGFVSLLSHTNSHKIGLAYYIPSVVGGLVWLLGSFCYPFMPYLIFLGLSLKLGLFPFTGWAVTVSLGLHPHQLFFFLGPLKVGLLYLILFGSPVPVALSSLSFVFGLLILSNSSSRNLLLLASSLISFFFFTFMSSLSFIFYLSTYLVALSLLSDFPGLVCSWPLALLGLAGLPPLCLFWGKLFVLFSLPTSNSVIFLFLNGICLPAYLSFLGSVPSVRTSSLVHLVLTSYPFVFLFINVGA